MIDSGLWTTIYSSVDFNGYLKIAHGFWGKKIILGASNDIKINPSFNTIFEHAILDKNLKIRVSPISGVNKIFTKFLMQRD